MLKVDVPNFGLNIPVDQWHSSEVLESNTATLKKKMESMNRCLKRM